MTPAARIAAAIAVLDRIAEGEPAEKALIGWARGARYAGSGDRAAVRDHVFQALRCWRSYACLGGAGTGRGRMIGALRAQGIDPDSLFDGQGHAPAPLSGAERRAGAPPAEAADRLDLDPWLLDVFRASLGDGAEETARALQGRAPVVLRVNLRKTDRAGAVARLAESGISARPDEIAATALIVEEGARRIAGSEPYRDGQVELQDGSSQAAMETVAPVPGARVLDYCAGGGGKALALAARSDVQVFAHDAAPRRMADLPARAARAGVKITLLDGAGVAGAAPFDLVLCDVPCSGSGTWRRAPEAKWRLTPGALRALTRSQDGILDTAADLAAPEGSIVYATCSVLRDENEARIDAFLARRPGWRLALSRRWPVSEAGDGFFVAHLSRNC